MCAEFFMAGCSWWAGGEGGVGRSILLQNLWLFPSQLFSLLRLRFGVRHVKTKETTLPRWISWERARDLNHHLHRRPGFWTRTSYLSCFIDELPYRSFFLFFLAGKLVPFVELTVAHASVLTILAISFERYYVITRPLRAGYTCTRMRALLVIVAIWILGCLTSRYLRKLRSWRDDEGLFLLFFMLLRCNYGGHCGHHMKF